MSHFFCDVCLESNDSRDEKEEEGNKGKEDAALVVNIWAEKGDKERYKKRECQLL